MRQTQPQPQPSELKKGGCPSDKQQLVMQENGTSNKRHVIRKRMELLRLNTDLAKYAHKFRRREVRPLRESLELGDQHIYPCPPSASARVAIQTALQSARRKRRPMSARPVYTPRNQQREVQTRPNTSQGHRRVTAARTVGRRNLGGGGTPTTLGSGTSSEGSNGGIAGFPPGTAVGVEGVEGGGEQKIESKAGPSAIATLGDFIESPRLGREVARLQHDVRLLRRRHRAELEAQEQKAEAMTEAFERERLQWGRVFRQEKDKRDRISKELEITNRTLKRLRIKLTTLRRQTEETKMGVRKELRGMKRQMRVLRREGEQNAIRAITQAHAKGDDVSKKMAGKMRKLPKKVKRVAKKLSRVVKPLSPSPKAVTRIEKEENVEKLRHRLGETENILQKRNTMIANLKDEISDRELMLKKVSEAHAKLAAESLAPASQSEKQQNDNEPQPAPQRRDNGGQEGVETVASLFQCLVKEWSMRSVPAGSFQDLLGLLQDQEVVPTPLYYSTSGVKGNLSDVMSDVRAFFASNGREVDQILRHCMLEMAKSLARGFGDALRMMRSPASPCSGGSGTIGTRRSIRRRSRRASDSLVRFTSHYVAGRAIDDALRRLSVDDGSAVPDDGNSSSPDSSPSASRKTPSK